MKESENQIYIAFDCHILRRTGQVAFLEQIIIREVSTSQIVFLMTKFTKWAWFGFALHVC